jgi:hypothetical protein
MSSLSYFPNMSSDHLSVEVNSDGFYFPENQFDSPFEPDISSLFDSDLFSPEINIAGVCESSDFIGKISCFSSI